MAKNPMIERVPQRSEPSGQYRSWQGHQRGEAPVEAPDDEHDERLVRRLDPQAAQAQAQLN